MDFIKTHNGEFLRALITILNNIHPSLHEAVIEPDFDPDALKTAFTELKTALDALDAGTMNRVVNRLLEMTKGTEFNAGAGKVSYHILMSEYDEASKLIETLTNEL